MDEVDGMSAGDRGGVGALNVLIKKTKVSVYSFDLIWLMIDPDGPDLQRQDIAKDEAATEHNIWYHLQAVSHNHTA
ncbi:MAG: hypothetical protein EOO38_08470 [Cytophagaceae bacterium]|nr:MAG: hypothetical protein EOO38_08470 [Cytophagaceae bacterium]